MQISNYNEFHNINSKLGWFISLNIFKSYLLCKNIVLFTKYVMKTKEDFLQSKIIHRYEFI